MPLLPLIENRIAVGKLKREHGVKVLLYGMLFTYDIAKKDFSAIVVDGVSFIEHIIGLTDACLKKDDINNELYFLLLDLNYLPAQPMDIKGRKIYNT